jgi:hypothetical protein
VKRRASASRDVSYVVELLRSRYGAAPPSVSLEQLRHSNPQLDRFDWSLLILVIEIDLKIRIPRRLSDANRMTIGKFAAEIATLPKVAEASYTLDLITMLTQALLSADNPGPPSQARSGKSHHRKVGKSG